ncbi:MAG: glycosyltransferase family 2 protein [Flavobacterium sp.]|jgi:putative glycosyltransferase|uniref:glycosyltransferase family 2 protein n=1 Tax=Flavobacterium sp. TaxID=239 RepID=UPI0022C73D3C|nr:glycosyltransferase family 2 protein [Flavobacterium sp.]MCZ8089281.1 glycosyltransferase family 2 protein [Flavobacterium sp.]MCZ8330044.1 glycosyltransferase family 2 protein [Flavobacterium sp.]
MKLSIVTTLYKSKGFLEIFLKEIISAIEIINVKEYELIFVNDGSPDNSVEYLLDRKKEISQIKIIDLSRNFGHHYAIQAGLNYSSGEYVFLIDNDLETPPSILVDYYKEIKNDTNLDVVYGYQEARKGNFIEKKAGSVFWVLINKLSDTKIPHNILTERLMTRQYVNELLRLQDANLFIGGMFYWVGFNQKGIPVKKGIREGASTYTIKRRAELMLQAITSFSGKPLEWLFYIGISISSFSFLFLMYLAVQKVIHQDDVQLGWTSIVAINLLILGIISTFLGLIGIYIFKIFKQVQGRPNAIIKKVYE